jgi:YVTN family beta-propeller protein
VPNHHAALITRIDPETNEVIAEIPVGVQPGGDGLEAFGSMWFPNFGESTVSRVDPATNTATSIDTGNGLVRQPRQAGGSCRSAAAMPWCSQDGPETSTVARTLKSRLVRNGSSSGSIRRWSRASTPDERCS